MIPDGVTHLIVVVGVVWLFASLTALGLWGLMFLLPPWEHPPIPSREVSRTIVGEEHPARSGDSRLVG